MKILFKRSILILSSTFDIELDPVSGPGRGDGMDPHRAKTIPPRFYCTEAIPDLRYSAASLWRSVSQPDVAGYTSSDDIRSRDKLNVYLILALTHFRPSSSFLHIPNDHFTHIYT